MIERVYLDTSVLAYAIWGHHPYRAPSRAVLAAVAGRRLEAHASVEVIQELTFHRLRRTTPVRAIEQARAAAAGCLLHPFDEDILELSSQLILGVHGLRGRDAVHAATALHHNLGTIISTDTAFDHVAGLRRVDPVEFAEGSSP